MGWRGTMRSISASMRAAERESQRQHKQYLKDQMISEASDAVVSWKEYIHSLISLHTKVTDKIDWQAIIAQKEPAKPERLSKNKDIATSDFESFKPRFWHRLTGRPEKKRGQLKKAIEDAREQDELDFRNALEEYENAILELREDKAQATRLLSGQPLAQKEVIEELQSLSADDLIGTAFSFAITDEYIHAMPKVHTDGVVPDYRRKQLKSGKLSQTKMPNAQFQELYQDYVCSVALRFAGDLFSLLPIEEVYVTCTSPMLDSVTGHIKDTPILSVHFVKETFSKLNLIQIDPSDSLRNFNHNMSFKRTKGFAKIEPIKPLD